MKTSLLLLGLCSFVLSCATAQENAAESTADRPTLRERWAARKAERQAEPAKRIDGPGEYTMTLEHDGETRRYIVHVPKSYVPSRPAPVVFSFHGGGATAEIQATDKFYGMISKSEQAGFIAVFPNGYSRLPSGKLATFNAGSCCGPAQERKIDDVGFVRKIVAELKTQLNVDAQRISANGMSNGGMMAYRLACEMADTFGTIASVAGTDGMADCRPSRPVSVLHIHARDDENMLFEGGAGKNSRTRVNYRSVNDTIKRWVQLNACSPVPRKVLDKPGQAMCESYTGCQGGVEVRLCVTETGGHSWPGGTKVRSGGTESSTAFRANDLIWDFSNRR